MHSSQCLICESELTYREKADSLKCVFCGKTEGTNTFCKNNHHVCSSCKSCDAKEIIRKFCLHSDQSDAIEMATLLMKHPALKMHCRDHHFLVPSVLLKTYYAETGETDKLQKGIEEAFQRASFIPEDSCSQLGTCGAAVGAGIFISIIKQVHNLSETPLRHANLITSEALKDVAENSGPRCCKRNTYLTIHRSVRFMVKYLNVNLSFPQQKTCTFFKNNKDCIKLACPYFP